VKLVIWCRWVRKYERDSSAMNGANLHSVIIPAIRARTAQIAAKQLDFRRVTAPQARPIRVPGRTIV